MGTRATDDRTFTARKDVTAEELLQAGDIGPCELIRGEVVFMPPPGIEHGDFVSEINARVRSFVIRRKLGRVVAGDAGFLLARDPDTVRGPDVAFIHRSRIPKAGLPKGYFEGAPDLAIEVVSPEDRWSEVEEKVREFISAGARLVWVFNPSTRAVHVYRIDGSVTRLTERDSVKGEDVLPGFSLSLRLLFHAGR
ncbi:MAG: Uma2 family endonuclease [Planctomycetota bacterium]